MTIVQSACVAHSPRSANEPKRTRPALAVQAQPPRRGRHAHFVTLWRLAVRGWSATSVERRSCWYTTEWTRPHQLQQFSRQHSDSTCPPCLVALAHVPDPRVADRVRVGTVSTMLSECAAPLPPITIVLHTLTAVTAAATMKGQYLWHVSGCAAAFVHDRRTGLRMGARIILIRTAQP